MLYTMMEDEQNQHRHAQPFVGSFAYQRIRHQQRKQDGHAEINEVLCFLFAWQPLTSPWMVLL